MKRAIVLAAALAVLGVIFVGPAGGQTTAPSLPDKWQGLSFNEMLSLALRLQGAGDVANANQVIQFCGTKASSLAQCRQMSGAAGTVMGQGGDAMLAKTVVDRLLWAFGQCGMDDGAWGVQLLASQGKGAEANVAMASVVKNVKTVLDCYLLKDAAKAMLGDGNQFLAATLAAGPAGNLGNANFDMAGWAADLLAAQGKTDAAKQVLTGMGTLSVTAKNVLAIYGKAKTVMPEDQAAQWLVGLYAGCLAGGKLPFDESLGVIPQLVAEKRLAEANTILQTAGNAAKLVWRCRKLQMAAQTVMAAKDADAWTEGLLLNQAHDDLGKCTDITASWAATFLAGRGKTTEAKAVLDAMAGRVTTVNNWRYTASISQSVLGAASDAWAVDLFFQKCLSDLDKCSLADGAAALATMAKAGQNDKAKPVLDKLGARVTTVDECSKMTDVVGLVLGAKANDWLANILLTNCKDDFPKCDSKQASWAAGVLQKAGKTQEAKALLDSLKGRVSMVGQTRQMTQQLKGSSTTGVAMQWAADVLQNSCQADLAQCGLGDAGWAAWVLAKAGKKDDANALLAGIEAGGRNPSLDVAGIIDDSQAVAMAYQSLGQNGKAQQWMMKAYQAAVGTDDARTLADAHTLAHLSFAMSGFDLIGKGKGYSGYAAALAGLARQGNLEGENMGHVFLGQPLGTTDSQQILQAQLVDPSSGLPRVGVARVLAWSYRTSGDLDKWRQTLDGNIAASAGNPDAKALWLLARSYAETVVPVEMDPSRGMDLIDQAMATAQTPAVRLTVARELAGRFYMRSRAELAVSFLSSVENQFSGADLGTMLSLEGDAKQRLTSQHLAQAQWLAASEQARKQGLLAYYRQRLAIHQANNDSNTADSLQAAITSLENEMGQ